MHIFVLICCYLKKLIKSSPPPQELGKFEAEFELEAFLAPSDFLCGSDFGLGLVLGFLCCVFKSGSPVAQASLKFPMELRKILAF